MASKILSTFRAESYYVSHINVFIIIFFDCSLAVISHVIVKAETTNEELLNKYKSRLDERH